MQLHYLENLLELVGIFGGGEGIHCSNEGKEKVFISIVPYLLIVIMNYVERNSWFIPGWQEQRGMT